MNRAALRTLIFLAVMSVAGIIFTQLYWVKKSLDLQDKQFDHRVHVALNSVSNKLISNSKIELETLNRISNNYYTLDFTSQVKPKNLEEYLVVEFRNQSLFEPFEYGLFDCNTDTLIFGKFIHSLDVQNIENVKIDLPSNENYYIAILFPRKKSYFADDWTILAVFSVVILIVLFFFTFSIITILKQKQVGEVKNDFVNNMTHEFKTPIATIGLASDVLMRENIYNFPKKINHYARIISEENKRLKSQVDTILQVALTDAKKIELKLEVLDVDDIILQNAATFSVRANDKQGHIRTNLQAENSLINGDKVHITNILYNLLDNALKYCDKIPEILISTRNKGSYLEISIEDNGKGIESEDIDQIFDKFYRVSSGNRHDVKGFGIGLFYVKNMVKMHKGDITLKSKLGEGTTFYITIPIIK
ncbi:MAG TPA: HAMP domain-containing sensor histidine kinase [Chitinophagales bacterium]|nr:HAMP domain-containing sensor histidine kinase [Chitinophagales bacterium]